MKNKDIYIQEEASSCGARCIQSIVSYYGGYVPLETALEDTNTDKSGTNAYELVTALKKYGFKAYGMKVPVEQIDRNKLPVIAHTVKNGYEHFLVVYEIDETGILTMDPEVGKVHFSLEDFKKIFTEEIIISFPIGEIPKYKKSKSILRVFSPILKENRSRLVRIFVLNLTILVFSLVINYNIKLLSLSDSPLKLTTLFFLIQLSISLLEYFKEKTLLATLKTIDTRVLNTFTAHIFRLPMRYLNNKRVGEIVKKIEDMTSIKDLLFRISILNSLDFLTLVICGIVLFLISKELTLVYAIVTLLYFVITVMTSKRTYMKEKEVYRHYNRYSGTLVEYLDGCESIKNLNEEDSYLKKIEDSFFVFNESSLKKGRRDAKIHTCRETVFCTGLILANLVGFLSLGDSFTLYDLITSSSIFTLFFNSFESILETFTQFLKMKAMFMETCEFLDVQEEKTHPTYEEPLKYLEIKNFSYAYDHFHFLFKNFSLKIEKGDKILLKGPSGIGKSTLVKAMSGRLDTYDGRIRINDKDIKELAIKSLKNYCLYVGQEEKLFTGSIFENIVQVAPDKERFDSVSRVTMADEIWKYRRDGENTALLEGASNLSGGEKARIVLARALYKQPAILIIDETLSSVSEAMETAILENLMAMPELTLIYITHRNREKNFKKIIEFRKDGSYEIKRVRNDKH